MAKSRKEKPRYIVIGDYVRHRSKDERGVVFKINTEVKEIGSGKTTRTTTTSYKVKKFSAQNRPYVVDIPEKETVKLSDEDKMDPEILRYDNIFLGKGLPSKKLNEQAAKSRSSQWAASNTLKKENVQFCGIVSPSFDVLCQVFFSCSQF